LKRDHVDSKARIEAFFVQAVMEQIDFPVPFLAYLDKVGGGLNAVIKAFFSFEGAALPFVPIAGFGKAQRPRFIESPRHRQLWLASDDVVEVSIANARIELKTRTQSSFCFRIGEVPLVHFADDVPIDAGMLRRIPR